MKRRPQGAIWLALAIALLAHIFLLLTPANWQTKQLANRNSAIEIQVKYENIQPFVEPQAEPVVQPDDQAEPSQQPAQQTPQTQTSPKLAEPTVVEPLPVPVQPPAQPIPANDRPDDLKTPQQLSRTILSSQFITEPSVTDELFGTEIAKTHQEEAKEFHFPLKPNMITMLDKPMPDLPFEYTEGLVYFAYEPGVKGDVQRFWDKITPEFGWRTKYGTQVKCVWVLVIAACGWGRSKD